MLGVRGGWNGSEIAKAIPIPATARPMLKLAVLGRAGYYDFWEVYIAMNIVQPSPYRPGNRRSSSIGTLRDELIAKGMIEPAEASKRVVAGLRDEARRIVQTLTAKQMPPRSLPRKAKKPQPAPKPRKTLVNRIN